MSRLLSFFLMMVCFSSCAWAGSVTPSLPTNKIPLVAHKAVYDVKLLSAKNGSQIVGIRGKMTFTWKPSCNGWITDHNFKLRYDYADTEPSFIESDFTTFESTDHKELQFSSRRLRNGDVSEVIRGSATPEKANFTSPQASVYTISKGTIFPTEHTDSLLQSARTGKKFLSSHVFDGSDQEGVLDVSSVIGKPQTNHIYLQPVSAAESVIDKAIDKKLLSGRSWPVRMGFFTEAQEEPTADYEMSLILQENGIISDMIIDYTDFTIRQKLVNLETIPADRCGRTPKD
jgi:EipB-like